jgi:predicted Zn-dependent protease
LRVINDSRVFKTLSLDSFLLLIARSQCSIIVTLISTLLVIEIVGLNFDFPYTNATNFAKPVVVILSKLHKNSQCRDNVLFKQSLTKFMIHEMNHVVTNFPIKKTRIMKRIYSKDVFITN